MASDKRYFISHAGPDKPTAIALKAQLDEDAWVDLFEIEVGDVLIEEISRGIEAASDFVLLWSEASAASKWVKFELHMAFIRYLEDNAIALRVLVLDETPVPLYLRVFLQGRSLSSVSEMADALLGAGGRSTPRRQFFNRNDEINAIEAAIYDPSISSVWVVGMAGTGKKSLVAESIRRLTVGTGASRTIAVDGGTAEAELDLFTAAALGAPAGRAEATVDELSELISRRISEFAANRGIWVFEEAEHWLDDDGTLGRLAALAMSSVHGAGAGPERLGIFTSRRAPHLTGQWELTTKIIRLGGLAQRFAVPMLRSRGAQGTDEQLALAAQELDGHPLALEIAAPQTPLNSIELAQHRLKVATDLIPEEALTSNTWHLLEALAAIDGPFSVEDLALHLALSADEIGAAIAQAVEYSLVEYTDTSRLELHPLILDYYLRSFRKHPDSRQSTDALATMAKARLTNLEAGTSEFVVSLVTTFKLLGMAGRFDEARALRSGLIGTLFATATELFHEKRYVEALEYVDESLTGNVDVDKEALSLKSKILAHIDRLDEARVLGDMLVEQYGDSPRILRDRGRVEQVANNWDGAIDYFEMALALRKRPNPNVLTDIAQAELRRNNLDAAGAAAKSAISLGGDNPYTLSLYAQVLERQERFTEAEVIIETAVKREPRNSAYRHRLGRIAQARGDRVKALQQFRAAVELDSGFAESWLSIASLLMDDGDLEGAESALRSAKSVPGMSPAVHLNLSGRLAWLRHDLPHALEFAAKALSARRDSRNLALSVRVTIDAAESHLVSESEARADVRRWAKELDAAGELIEVLDIAKRYPQYF